MTTNSNVLLMLFFLFPMLTANAGEVIPLTPSIESSGATVVIIGDYNNIGEVRIGNTQTIIRNKSFSNSEIFIEDYFSNVKNIPLNESWNLLSESFKKNLLYEDYSDWWNQKVYSVRIKKIYISGNNKVDAKLLYKMKDGSEYCSHDSFGLTFNNNSLEINSQTFKLCEE